MDNNYILLTLVFVAILIISIYYIYQSAKKSKEEQEKIDREYAEYERKHEELRIKERQDESIKWNNKIQDKFTEKAKYKTNRPIKALIGDYTNSMAPLTNSVLRIMGIQTEIVPTASDIIDRINAGNEYDIIIYENGNIEIIFKYKDKFDEALNFIKKHNCIEMNDFIYEHNYDIISRELYAI